MNPLSYFQNSGVASMVLSTLFFAAMSYFVKNLSHIPFFEIVFFRALVSAILCVAILKKTNTPFFGNNKRLLIIRGIAGSLGLSLYFLTIQNLPFAVAVVLQYLSPVFTILISLLFLKEKPALLQWIALSNAFFAVIMINDFHQSFEVSVLYGLGILAAVFSAIAYTTIRVLKNTEHSVVIIFYFALVTLVVTTPFAMLQWQTPELSEWLQLIGIGVCAQLAQYCMTIAYQKERASKVSTITYLNVVWALLLSVFVWHESLPAKTYVGIGLILMSAILIALSKSETKSDPKPQKGTI